MKKFNDTKTLKGVALGLGVLGLLVTFFTGRVNAAKDDAVLDEKVAKAVEEAMKNASSTQQ